MDTITVITLTRGRPNLLRRAISSVARQKSKASIQHLILIDECYETKSMLEDATDLPPNLAWYWCPRSEGGCPDTVPGRLAQLRNLGVKIANTDWIAFLDDDNEFKENHLEELLVCAKRTGLKAVHSHRIMLNRDGTPFLEAWSPWHIDMEEAKIDYEDFCRQGVLTPRSCVVKDRVDPIGHPDPVRMVDMSAWLFAREVLLETPFQEKYDAGDWEHVVVEDNKLIADLLENEVSIGCSEKATLIYYLGGYTNNRQGTWYLSG